MAEKEEKQLTIIEIEKKLVEQYMRKEGQFGELTYPNDNIRDGMWRQMHHLHELLELIDHPHLPKEFVQKKIVGIDREIWDLNGKVGLYKRFQHTRVKEDEILVNVLMRSKRISKDATERGLSIDELKLLARDLKEAKRHLYESTRMRHGKDRNDCWTLFKKISYDLQTLEPSVKVMDKAGNGKIRLDNVNQRLAVQIRSDIEKAREIVDRHKRLHGKALFEDKLFASYMNRLNIIERKLKGQSIMSSFFEALVRNKWKPRKLEPAMG